MNAIIKAGKTILNALAFANADNYSEFRALLRQTDDLPGSDERQTQYRLVSDNPAVTTVAQSFQQTL
jgi:hypothetical protein